MRNTYLKHTIGETSGDEGADVRQRDARNRPGRKAEGRDYKPGITDVRVHEEHGHGRAENEKEKQCAQN